MITKHQLRETIAARTRAQEDLEEAAAREPDPMKSNRLLEISYLHRDIAMYLNDALKRQMLLEGDK